ncbi:MAG: 23S rRNA (adenine(2503)-C(2))-methyltransferase RlmN [Clostridiales bacterium]
MDKQDLRSLDVAELQQVMAAWGEPAYRGKQLFGWLQQKGVMDFGEMSDLPEALRDKLAGFFTLTCPKILRKQVAIAGDTLKLLLELNDGEKIEMALMLYPRKGSRDRATCCVSCQSGCAMGCAFCATGRNRQFRNLTAGEIAVQALLADRLAREQGFPGLTNVVFMGMGEPLYNLQTVKKAVDLLNDPMGLNIGRRKITVSTCGIVPQIYEMSHWEQPVELAVSLHSADDKLRKEMMPGAARWNLAALMAACRAYRQQTSRRITFEYALFEGINDNRAAARLLADLLTGEDILVNIIPANPVEKSDFHPSAAGNIKEFIAGCEQYGINYQIREIRGQDIDAACGQLRQRS